MYNYFLKYLILNNVIFMLILLDGPMGEYAWELCFCLFNKKTYKMFLSYFFKYYAWKPMHQSSTNFKLESTSSYCESTGPLWLVRPK